MAVLHSTPPARPGSTKGIHPCDGSAQCRGCQCTALSPQLLVALKSARRSAISAARCSAKRCLSSGSPWCRLLVVARGAYQV